MSAISEEDYIYLNYLDLRVKRDLDIVKILGAKHRAEMSDAIDALVKSNDAYDEFASKLSWWMRFIRFCGGNV
jgi:hypothetical protein